MPLKFNPLNLSLDLVGPSLELGNSFNIFQTDTGTSPVPGSAVDTLTFTSSDDSIDNVGNATTDTIDFRVSNDLIVNVKKYGAIGDGVADDTAAITSANTAAATLGGVLYFPPGTYLITSTITFTTHVDGRFAQINIATDTTGIQIGDGTNYVVAKQLYLPKITYTTKVGLGWSGTNIGYKIYNLRESQVILNETKNFTIGAQITSSSGKGNVYNNYFLGTFNNNQIQLLLQPSAQTGWVNENNFFGGRFLFNTPELQAPNTAVTGQPSTRNILIKMYQHASANMPNNNIFYKPSLEGDVPEYHVEMSAAFQNVIDYGRWEADTPKVYFSSFNATKSSKSNLIRYGYGSERVIVSEDTDAHYNSIQTYGTTQWNGDGTNQLNGDGTSWLNAYSAGDKGMFVYQNTGSSAYPILVGLKAQATGDTFTLDPRTDYQFNISANSSLYKAEADVYPRLKLDHLNGRIYSGLGLADPTSYISSSNGTNWKVVGGNWVIQSLAANLNILDTDTIGVNAAPAITFGDVAATKARIGFSTSSTAFRIGTATSSGSNVVFTDSSGDAGLIASGTFAAGAASNPSGHKILGHGSSTSTTGPNPAAATSLAIRNTSATTNNIESLVFLNSASTPGPVAGIDGVNIDHNGSGSQTGALKLWTANAGTKTYAQTIAQDGTINFPLQTAYQTLITDSSKNLTGVTHGTSGYVWTSNGATSTPSWQTATGGTPGTDTVGFTELKDEVGNYTDLTLNNTQILALNGTPQAFPASAPGSGKVLMVTGAVWIYTYGGTAYTTNLTLNIVNTGQTNALATFGANLGSTATHYRFAGPTASPNTFANTGLSAFVSVGNPGGGHASSTLVIRVFYRVVTLP